MSLHGKPQHRDLRFHDSAHIPSPAKHARACSPNPNAPSLAPFRGRGIQGEGAAEIRARQVEVRRVRIHPPHPRPLAPGGGEGSCREARASVFAKLNCSFCLSKNRGMGPPSVHPRHNMLRSRSRQAVEVKESARFRAHPDSDLPRRRRNKSADSNRTFRNLLTYRTRQIGLTAESTYRALASLERSGRIRRSAGKIAIV